MWKVKKSKIHGNGIIATNNIKKELKIIQYIGEKVTKKEGDLRSSERIKNFLNKKNVGSVYIFELNKKFDIDGSPLYNKARYINHSCNPNCEVDGKGLKLWIFALRNIKKDEELSYDYGFGYDKNYKDYVCKCGAKNCCGYIVREGSRWRIEKNAK